MKMPGATGEVTGEPLSSRLNSPAAKKCVLLENGPPREAADWPSESLVNWLPLVALAAVKPESAAAVSAGRHSSSTSPWNLLPPLLVTMLITPPAVAPYSAEKALASTSISSTARTGSVLNSVWRPQLLVTMLITPPAVAPYSAEKALASTFISSTARTGSVLNSVWRPQLSL